MQMGTDRLYRNVGNYQSTLLSIPVKLSDVEWQTADCFLAPVPRGVNRTQYGVNEIQTWKVTFTILTDHRAAQITTVTRNSKTATVNSQPFTGFPVCRLMSDWICIIKLGTENRL